jgi:hypothetical protein
MTVVYNHFLECVLLRPAPHVPFLSLLTSLSPPPPPSTFADPFVRLQNVFSPSPPPLSLMDVHCACVCVCMCMYGDKILCMRVYVRGLVS